MKKTHTKTEKHNEAPGGPRATGPAAEEAPMEPLVAVQNLTVTADAPGKRNTTDQPGPGATMQPTTHGNRK